MYNNKLKRQFRIEYTETSVDTVPLKIHLSVQTLSMYLKVAL